MLSGKFPSKLTSQTYTHTTPPPPPSDKILLPVISHCHDGTSEEGDCSYLLPLSRRDCECVYQWNDLKATFRSSTAFIVVFSKLMLASAIYLLYDGRTRLNLLVLKSESSAITRPLPCPPMPWLVAPPGHLQSRCIDGCVGYTMTSSNGSIFRITGHLCGEFTVPGEFPAQMPVTGSFDVFFDLRLNKRSENNREAGDLRRYRAHYDVIVM